MLILAWLLIRAIVALLVGIGDGMLVIARLKWRPSMGRARWRWSRAWRDRKNRLVRNATEAAWHCGCSGWSIAMTELPVYKTPLARKDNDDGTPCLFTLVRMTDPPCVIVHPDRWEAFVVAIRALTPR